MSKLALRQAIRKIHFSMVSDHINFGSDSESDEMFNEDEAKATDAILSIVIKELEGQIPPKKQKMTYAEASKDFKLMELANINYGYNQAIDDCKSILKEMGS